MLNKLIRRLPRGGRRMAFAYGALSLALVGTGTMAYGAIGPAEASTTSNSRVVTAQMGTVTQSVSATGNVQPASTLNVGFATSGTVSEVDVTVGQQVQAGDVLAKLDPTAAQTNMQVAQLNLTAAQAKLSSALAGTTSTSGAQGAAPPATVDASAVASARAAVLQAQAGLSTAYTALADTTLTAPSAGTITTLTGLVGQPVSGSGSSPASSSPGASSAAGGGGGTSATSSPSSASTSSFLTLADLSTLQVKVGFAEIDAVKIATGQPATVTISALTGTQLTGNVVAVDTSATVVSNVVTYSALVSIAGPPTTLKPGMTASVTVQVASHPNVLEVPTAAIQTQGGASFVNVDQSGKPVLTPVTTGLQGDSTTEITSGLSAGQQLLVSTGTASTSTAATTATRTGTGAAGGGAFPGGGGGGAGGFGGGGAN
jgi:macrolide-specific efflux system membrane fusion protein